MSHRHRVLGFPRHHPELQHPSQTVHTLQPACQ